jgi:hypothetical protein
VPEGHHCDLLERARSGWGNRTVWPARTFGTDGANRTIGS